MVAVLLSQQAILIEICFAFNVSVFILYPDCFCIDIKQIMSGSKNV